jgi:integrase
MERRQKVGRNKPCPCGSGKKYKACCINKKFDWVEEDGDVYRSVPLSSEVAETLKRRIEDNNLGPEDLLFPDIDVEEYMRGVSEAMKRANIHPSLIYAFRKTGFILTEENKDLMPDNQVEEWNEAIEEWDELEKSKN